jgi:RNA polymerase sigma-70 factor (ECF subfamily)
MNSIKFNIIIPPQDVQENPECLEQIAAGNANAFAWLYKNYCKRLYDYLFLLTNDTHLSEDIVQEIFLKIWTNKEKLAEIKNFNAWIFFNTKNLLTDKWRKSQNEKQVFKNIASTQPQTEHNLFHQRNEEKRISNAVTSLSPKQQLVYKMIREEGHTRDQVSKQLKISPNTVRNTMQNALHNLRQHLRES